LLGDVNRRVTFHSRAEKYGDQFGVGQNLRAFRGEPFARTVLGGHVLDAWVGSHAAGIALTEIRLPHDKNFVPPSSRGAS